MSIQTNSQSPNANKPPQTPPFNKDSKMDDKKNPSSAKPLKTDASFNSGERKVEEPPPEREVPDLQADDQDEDLQDQDDKRI